MGIQISGAPPRRPFRDDQQRTALSNPDSAELGPMLAGAQARGMADIQEALGLGAIFLDRSASVLFASARARQAVAGAIAVSAAQLSGTGPAARAALDGILTAAVRGETTPETPFPVENPGAAGFTLQVLPAPPGPASCLPLLQSIVIVRNN